MKKAKKKTKTKARGKTLTPLQKKFCDIIHLMEISGRVNQAEALRLAGSKCRGKALKSAASRMLTNVNVSAYLSRARARVKRAVEMTEEEILHEYANLARSNLPSYYNDDGSLKKFSQLTEAQAAAMQSIDIEEHEYKNKRGQKGVTRKIKIRLHTKKGALDSLSKIRGMMKGDAEEAARTFATALHEAMKKKE